MINFQNLVKFIFSLWLLTLLNAQSFANVDFKDPSIPLWEINGQISKSDVKKVEDAANFATQNTEVSQMSPVLFEIHREMQANSTPVFKPASSPVF